jgi:hypothetical protein
VSADELRVLVYAQPPVPELDDDEREAVLFAELRKPWWRWLLGFFRH